MMEGVRGVALVVAITACYSPSPPLAIPCGDNGACPSGQVCDPRTDRCGAPSDASVDDGPASDAPPDAVIDALPDAMIDAMPDAMPNPSGCSDGQREAFSAVATYPAIAGCAATWAGTPSLRATTSGTACGDDLGACGVPADACATGWHVCGVSGAIAELTVLQPQECTGAGAGRFVAAMSHCTNNVGTCEYAATLPCFDQDFCAEPVCCGADCFTLQGCIDGVWLGATPVTADQSAGCGKLPATDATGVMCCKN